MENHEMVEVENPDGKTLEVQNPDEMNLQIGSELGEFDNLGEKCAGFESSLQHFGTDERLVDMHGEGFVVGHSINVDAVSVTDAVEGESVHVGGEKESVCVEDNGIGCFGNEKGLFSEGNDEGLDVGDNTNGEALNVADAVKGDSFLVGEKKAVGVQENGISFMDEEGLLSEGTDEDLAAGNDINVEAHSGVDDVEREHLHIGEKETVGVEENDNGCFANEEGLLANESIYKDAENVEGSVEVALGDELNSCSGNLCEQTAVNETVEDETQEDVLLEDNGVDTSTKIEVSGHNISIYVDFSGPLSESCCGDVDDVDCSGLLVFEGESQGDDNEEEELISKFHVGDVVWIKTKSQSWWPGKIYDPLDSSMYAVNNDQKNCLLVGYFGINYIAWCLPSKLNPFLENFEQMAGQSKCRSFSRALEKALDEFGKCLKLEMHCFCVYKGQQLGGNASVDGEGSRPDIEVGRYGEYSVAHFIPAEFLEKTRNLALSVCKIGMLELTVAKSRLAAFYYFMGHKQLPIHQLKELSGKDCIGERLEGKSNDAWLSAESGIQKKDKDLAKTFNDDLDTVAENREGCFIDEKFVNSDLATNSSERKSRKYFEFIEGLDDDPITMSKVDDAGFVGSPKTGEKSSEFRERKKSKYLCYPYVEGLRTETEDRKSRKISGEAETMNTVACHFVGFCPAPITSSKRFQKKWFKKIISGDVMSHNSELVNASVANLLSDLHFLAVDCWCLSETGNFDLIEWFFSRFRISAFHDESIYETYCENVVGSNADAALEKDTQNEGPTSANVKAELKKRKARNPSMTKTKGNSDLSESVSDLVKDNQEKGPVMPNGKHVPKKSKKQNEASQAGMPTNEMSSIPDLNGNGSTGSVISHVEGKARPKKRRKKGQLQNEHGNNMKTGTLSAESKATGASSIGASPESNMGEFTINVIPENNTGGFTVSVPNSKENSVVAGLFAKDPAATTSVLMEGNPAPRKRKRKEKSTSEQTVRGSSIPDLNGTTAETGTLEKAEKKRRKKGEATSGQVQKKSTTGMPDISVNHGKRKISRKALGTSLFLTFAPGATMPSEEVLNTTFAKFGSLKESETKVSKELCNAQVVFLKRADAGKAHKSLVTSNPFGEALLNSCVQRHLTAAVGQAMKGHKAPAKLPGPLPVVGEAPPIDFIRHNLEMMTAMLEKSGDNLSPELKAKLESEIKGLLQKVSFMSSGSSS